MKLQYKRLKTCYTSIGRLPRVEVVRLDVSLVESMSERVMSEGEGLGHPCTYTAMEFLHTVPQALHLLPSDSLTSRTSKQD